MKQLADGKVELEIGDILCSVCEYKNDTDFEISELQNGEFKRRAESEFYSIENLYGKDNSLFINGQLFNTKDIIIPYGTMPQLGDSYHLVKPHDMVSVIESIALVIEYQGRKYKLIGDGNE